MNEETTMKNDDDLSLATRQALDQSAIYLFRALKDDNVLDREALIRDALLRVYRVAVRDAVQQIAEWGPR